jgi:hypothetical protein
MAVGKEMANETNNGYKITKDPQMYTHLVFGKKRQPNQKKVPQGTKKKKSSTGNHLSDPNAFSNAIKNSDEPLIASDEPLIASQYV